MSVEQATGSSASTPAGNAPPVPVIGSTAGTAPAAGTEAPAAPAAPEKATEVAGSVLGTKDGKPAAEGEKKPEAPPPVGEIEIKLPDGLKADDAEIQLAKDFAKELGLDSDKASKALAWELKREAAIRDALVTQEVKAEKEAAAKGLEEIKADPKLGGTNLSKTLMSVNKAIDWYDKQVGHSKLRETIDTLKAGNSLELVRFFNVVGAALAEDNSSAPSGGPSGGAQPTEDQAWNQFYNPAQRKAG